MVETSSTIYLQLIVSRTPIINWQQYFYDVAQFPFFNFGNAHCRIATSSGNKKTNEKQKIKFSAIALSRLSPLYSVWVNIIPHNTGQFQNHLTIPVFLIRCHKIPFFFRVAVAAFNYTSINCVWGSMKDYVTKAIIQSGKSRFRASFCGKNS